MKRAILIAISITLLVGITIPLIILGRNAYNLSNEQTDGIKYLAENVIYEAAKDFIAQTKGMPIENITYSEDYCFGVGDQGHYEIICCVDAPNPFNVVYRSYVRVGLIEDLTKKEANKTVWSCVYIEDVDAEKYRSNINISSTK